MRYLIVLKCQRRDQQRLGLVPSYVTKGAFPLLTKDSLKKRKTDLLFGRLCCHVIFWSGPEVPRRHHSQMYGKTFIAFALAHVSKHVSCARTYLKYVRASEASL